MVHSIDTALVLLHYKLLEYEASLSTADNSQIHPHRDFCKSLSQPQCPLSFFFLALTEISQANVIIIPDGDVPFDKQTLHDATWMQLPSLAQSPLTPPDRTTL